MWQREWTGRKGEGKDNGQVVLQVCGNLQDNNMLLLYCLPPCGHIHVWCAVLLCVALPAAAAVMYVRALTLNMHVVVFRVGLGAVIVLFKAMQYMQQNARSRSVLWLAALAKILPFVDDTLRACRRSGGGQGCASLLLLWNVA